MLTLSKKTRWTILFIALLLVIIVKFYPSSPDETPAVAVKETASAPEQPKLVSPPPQIKKQGVVATKLPESEPVVEDMPPPEEQEENTKNKNFVLCEHIISGNSQFEFSGEIRMTNKGSEPIYGWSVTWEYADGATIFDSSEVALSGNNPYTGEYLSWNAEIAPGKTVKFSFSGLKSGDSAPLNVRVHGNFCM